MKISSEKMHREYVLDHIYMGIQRKSATDLIKRDCELEGLETYLYIRGDQKFDGRNEVFIIRCTDHILREIGISEADAWDKAAANTFAETKFDSLGNLLSGLIGMPFDKPSDTGIYVITNSVGMRGASAVLNKQVLEKIGELSGSRKFVILPSSIHEMLVVTDTHGMNIDDLSKIVREVNQGIVRPEERLTDRAYVVEI